MRPSLTCPPCALPCRCPARMSDRRRMIALPRGRGEGARLRGQRGRRVSFTAGLGALGTAAAVLLAAGGAGEEGRNAPELRVGRASGAITVDGKLDEAAWSRAAALKLAAAD